VVILVIFWFFMSISIGALVTGNFMVAIWTMMLCMMIQIEILVSQFVSWYNSGLGKVKK
jgi:hypothetical protein